MISQSFEQKCGRNRTYQSFLSNLQNCSILNHLISTIDGTTGLHRGGVASVEQNVVVACFRYSFIFSTEGLISKMLLHYTIQCQ